MAVNVGGKAAPQKGLTVDTAASNKNPIADAAQAIKETAANNAGKIAVAVEKEVAVVKKAVVAEVDHLAVELVGHARLWYNGILYEAGIVYKHTRDYAEHLLSLVGIKNLPIFKVNAPAKPKPVTAAGKPMVNLAAVKTATSTTVPEPAVPGAEQAAAAGAKGLDIGADDNDPELAAHLAQAAAQAENGQEGGENEQHATV